MSSLPPARHAGRPIRVVTVDDSVVARRLLRHIIAAHTDLELVGQGVSGDHAVALAAELRPDVITMDAQMPVLDGYEATRRIMSETPTPIVMVSAHAPQPPHGPFSALDAGAVAVLAKPGAPGSPGYATAAAELVNTLRAVAGLRLVTRRPDETTATSTSTGRSVARHSHRRHTVDLVAIGASTGGPAALGRILRDLPEEFPVPILVVQHIADGFDDGLVKWLDTVTPLTVRLAEDGMRPAAGEVIVAPNGTHMGVTRRLRVALVDEPPIGAHRPAATYLFQTVADAYGPRALALILTGIGRDGADGLVRVQAAGGRVLAQDEASCIVYGMPKAAVEAGVADAVVPLDEIGATIAAAVHRGRRVPG